MERTATICFVRLPVPGRVKTRLAASIGPNSACAWYKLCAERVLQACAASGAGRLVVQHSHVDSSAAVKTWVDSLALPVEAHVIAQDGDDDLGVKMQRAVEGQLREPGVSKVVVVGSDIPDLSAEVLRAAFMALDKHEVVLGPAADGGYYLLGLTRPIAQLFEGIAWSTPQVLAQTVHAASCCGAHLAPLSMLPTLHDIDTVADLRAWFKGVVDEADTAAGARRQLAQSSVAAANHQDERMTLLVQDILFQVDGG